jgi:hypothetical protein
VRDGGKDDLWIGAPEPVNGFIQIADTPGFGIKPNEDLL